MRKIDGLKTYIVCMVILALVILDGLGILALRVELLGALNALALMALRDGVKKAGG